MYVWSAYWLTADSQKSLQEGGRFLYTRRSLPSTKAVSVSWIFPGAQRIASARNDEQRHGYSDQQQTYFLRENGEKLMAWCTAGTVERLNGEININGEAFIVM